MSRCVADARVVSEACTHDISSFPAGIIANAFSESKENDHRNLHAASSRSSDGLRTEFGGEAHSLLRLG